MKKLDTIIALITTFNESLKALSELNLEVSATMFTISPELGGNAYLISTLTELAKSISPEKVGTRAITAIASTSETDYIKSLKESQFSVVLFMAAGSTSLTEVANRFKSIIDIFTDSWEVVTAQLGTDLALLLKPNYDISVKYTDSDKMQVVYSNNKITFTNIFSPDIEKYSCDFIGGTKNLRNAITKIPSSHTKDIIYDDLQQTEITTYNYTVNGYVLKTNSSGIKEDVVVHTRSISITVQEKGASITLPLVSDSSTGGTSSTDGTTSLSQTYQNNSSSSVRIEIESNDKLSGERRSRSVGFLTSGSTIETPYPPDFVETTLTSTFGSPSKSSSITVNSIPTIDKELEKIVDSEKLYIQKEPNNIGVYSAEGAQAMIVYGRNPISGQIEGTQYTLPAAVNFISGQAYIKSLKNGVWSEANPVEILLSTSASDFCLEIRK